jgi:hypothetical protein
MNMEGETMPWLSLSPVVLGAVSVILGGVWAMGRMLLTRVVNELEVRMAGHEARLERLDADFRKLLADLPSHYQQREDAIREYTAINAKLDRLYELMLRELK